MQRSVFGSFVASVVLTTSGIAQSFNVEWGSADTAPPPSYGGVGLPGVWNTFDSMPTAVRLPMVGLDGEPIAADIMNIGFDAIESADVPGTTGGDEALLDDCFTSFNDPVDGCLFIRFLEPGEYRVIMYGLAPDDDTLLSRLRIDQNTDEPVHVGGSWAGLHEPGVTYMEQTATVEADGRLDVHSGLPSGFIRSVLNGMQVVRIEPCPADLTGDSVLDLADLQAFIAAFLGQDPAADFAPPAGVFDLADLQVFVAAFVAGCP